MTGIGLSELVAYDEDDVVIAVAYYTTRYDEAGNPLGLIDYEAHELAGGELSDVRFIEQEQAAIPGDRPPRGWSVCPGGWVHGLVQGSPHTLEPCPGGEWRRPARGAKTWPEWADVRGFRAERTGPPGRTRLTALVHPTSGHRRERAVIEAEIERRLAEKRAEAIERAAATPRPRDQHGRFVPRPDVVPEPADLRDLLGGPDMPLVLDAEGRTVGRSTASAIPDLPLLRGGLQQTEDAGTRGEGDGRPEPPVSGNRPIPPAEQDEE